MENTLTLSKQTILELAEVVSQSVVTTLEKRGLIGNTTVVNNSNSVGRSEKTAYAKTESLLYNYRGFKRIVQERMEEIEEIRAHGVPQRCGGVGERVQASHTNVGIVLPEESVENAVHNVERSVQGTVQAVALIDRCMAAISKDPYYKILPMRYFEGLTQEDIALHFNCSQKTISINKSRLIKELALRMFPDQYVHEILN